MSGIHRFKASDGDLWAITSPEVLEDMVGVARDELAGFVRACTEAASPDTRRQFRLARMRSGLRNLTHPPEDDRENREWAPAELQHHLQITPAQMRQEMEALRGFWRRHAAAAEEKAVAEKHEVPDYVAPASTDDGEFNFKAGEQTAEMMGFGHLELEPAELEWLRRRTQELHAILKEPITREPARQMIFTELEIRRTQTIAISPITDKITAKAKADAHTRLKDLHKDHRETLKSLPDWATDTRDQIDFAHVVSDLVDGVLEYQADGSKRLIDGIFTGTEIQVMLRTSEQDPTPRYRFGLIAVCNAARAGFWDPRYKNQFSADQLRMIDTGFAEGIRRVKEEIGEVQPDLTSDDPVTGEYPSLHVAEEKE